MYADFKTKLSLYTIRTVSETDETQPSLTELCGGGGGGAPIRGSNGSGVISGGGSSGSGGATGGGSSGGGGATGGG